jgi:branched-chain amino acid aminotransferase
MSAWVNGEYRQLYDPVITILDRGFTLSDGLFETMFWDGYHVRHLSRHAARLQQSAEALGLPKPPSADEIEHIAHELLDRDELLGRTAALRLTWSAGPGERGLPRPDSMSPSFVLATVAYDPPRNPMDVIVSSIRRNETSPTSKYKTLSYLDNVMARREAETQSAQEALMLNTQGRLAGAAAGNVFLQIKGEIVTPPIEDGALPGVMRAALLEAYPAIIERPISTEDMADVEAGVISNALQGARPIKSIASRALAEDISEAMKL